ncbi:MAG: sensor domain-containing diguanylate cyclase [bacterium]|nr:sensor domain-containing diguanylate cyclase [bacterium]
MTRVTESITHESTPQAGPGDEHQAHADARPINAVADGIYSHFPELADREQLFARLIDGIQPGVCLLNADGEIVHANASCSELFGYEREELIGRSFLCVVKADRRDTMRHLHDEVIRGNQVHPFETTLVRSDGREIWTQISSNRLQFNDQFYRVMSVVDVTERKRLEESLQVLATTDPLTGVANRRHFLELARHEVLRGRRQERLPAVLMVDLDFFKRINDTCGHATGDRVLMEFSLCCEHGIRDSDIFGRLGGEEFAILLPELDEKAAAETAERLRKNVAALPVPAAGGEVYFSASFGVARAMPGETSIEAALHRADVALYRAKHGGRNRVEVYSDSMQAVDGEESASTDYARRMREADSASQANKDPRKSA